jgi:hypothetical protein
MGVIVPFPKVYRPHPPPEHEPLDALQGEIREALADAVAADELAATPEHKRWAS